MRYYVESDGRVFLVDRDGMLDLPKPEELPFAVDRIAPLPAAPDDVWFCVPQLDGHPEEWPLKDDLVDRHDVSAAVRRAVHASMPRVVVEGVCVDDADRVLLVKGSRGFTTGRWTLPGGFLRFGETPADGLLREVREEIGVEAHIEELLDVRGKLGVGSRLHWIMVFYRIRILGEPVPDPDEIAEVRYFPRADAVERLDCQMSEVVRSL